MTSNNNTQRMGELLRALFEILEAHPDGMRARDALRALQEKVELTPYEEGEYSSGGKRFDKMVRFATIACVKAGWLVKEKGIWTLTEAGKEAYRRYSSPTTFYRQARLQYQAWRKAAKADATSTAGDEEETAQNAAITFEEAEEWAWAEIERYLTHMPPYEFQRLVASLLKAMGYHVSWISPPGKDGGLDIVAWNDPLGTRPPRIKVQVKRTQQAVDVVTLRSFMAVLGDSDVGLFVSTGGFTRDAQREARAQRNRQITLVDLQRLFSLWVEYLEKMDTEARELLPLKPIYFLAPEG